MHASVLWTGPIAQRLEQRTHQMVPATGNRRRDSGKFGEAFAACGMVTPSRAAGALAEGVETSGGYQSLNYRIQLPTPATVRAVGGDIVQAGRKRLGT